MFTFLALHLTFVQRAPPSWTPERQTVWRWKRSAVLVGLALWSGLVCVSRCYLLYHTPSQVGLGVALGSTFGACHCVLTEIIPRYRPGGVAAWVREWVRSWLNVGGEWGLEVRDRWAAGKQGWEHVIDLDRGEPGNGARTKDS